MIRAVLLDLDDTLLDTNMDQFIPVYFDALSRKMKDYLPPKDMINLVLEGTKEMIQNRDSSKTNKEVFDGYFYPRLEYPASVVQPVIDSFYEDQFPILKKYTSPIPIAREFVSELLKWGCQVVIATNPLFPARAIEHRIDWAGLSDFSFSLITTYENSHFCKPDPNYFKEILTKLNVEPEETIMIGNDLENDIKPAKEAGLHAYWINNNQGELQGSLEKCFEWVRFGGFTKL
ncbi:MAG: HAD family hydrolase [Calditrichaceae bacterium]